MFGATRVRWFGAVVACSAAMGCLTNPADVTSGGSFIVNVTSNNGANLTIGDRYEGKQHAGNWAPSAATDAGWSIFMGQTNAFDAAVNKNCKSAGGGFHGKPAAGRTFALDAPADFQSSGADAGSLDLTDRGTFIFSEGCITEGNYNQWRSTSGTLTVVSVEEPSQEYKNEGVTGAKTVKFTFSNVVLEPDNADQGGATGSFTVDGEAQIDLFTGIDQ